MTGPADPRDRTMRLADGRALGWREYGAARGFPVLALHGTPGSRGKYELAGPKARELGLRLVCPDRWGYGLSDAPRRPRLATYAEDAVALAAELALERFAVLGISGGGPFAAALAAAMPGRVAALALVSPVGPIAGAPAAREIALFHQLCFRALPVMPGAIRFAFGVLRGVCAVSPSAGVAMTSARAGRLDRETLRQPLVRASLGETFRLGLERGSRGAVIDMDVFSRSWDVDLASIAAPSMVWIGLADRNVPVAAAAGLAAVIPGCALVEIENAGHFWIAAHSDEVLEWIASAVGNAQGRARAGNDDGAPIEERRD